MFGLKGSKVTALFPRNPRIYALLEDAYQNIGLHSPSGMCDRIKRSPHDHRITEMPGGTPVHTIALIAVGCTPIETVQ